MSHSQFKLLCFSWGPPFDMQKKCCIHIYHFVKPYFKKHQRPVLKDWDLIQFIIFTALLRTFSRHFFLNQGVFNGEEYSIVYFHVSCLDSSSDTRTFIPHFFCTTSAFVNTVKTVNIVSRLLRK